jgi:catechol 2,3-dioxygenase
MTDLDAVVDNPPIDWPRDIAHVGPVELFTPVLHETRDFFVNLMAMREVAGDDNSIYLHAWDDYQSFTIRVIQRDRAGIGRTYLRAASPSALARVVDRIEASGFGEEWSDNIQGLGRTYLFTDPDGHSMGVYWDVKRYIADDSDRPALKNQAAAFPGRGANIRRLDHVNYLTGEVPSTSDFLVNVLGARCTERIAKADGEGYSGVWYSVSNKSYDLVYTEDWAGANGRLHHLAFATDTREDILRSADVFLESGIHIESGPHKHAIQQTFFLYVWEPGGNRIELCNAGARLILAPDWDTITWTPEERAKGQAWGMKTISTFHTHGTPPLD